MVDMSINKLLDLISSGVAKPNRYRVNLILPPGVTEQFDGVMPLSVSGQITRVDHTINRQGRIGLMASAASLPSRMLDTMESRVYGQKRRLPFSYAVSENVNVTLTTTKDFPERKYIEVWQGAVANISSNTMNYPAEYLGQVEISALDAKGNKTYSVTLVNAYPMSLGNTELSYNANNTAAFTPASFSYHTWYSNIIN